MILGDKLSKIAGMDETESEFKKQYIRRVAELRQARDFSQQQMADALGIPLERYKKYENRSVLPPHLLARFAAIVGKDIGFVVTGRASRGPRGANSDADTGG